MKKKFLAALAIIALVGCSKVDDFISKSQLHNNNLYRDVNPGVYQIIVDGGAGTGWAYRDGYVVTNKHVVDSSNGIVLVKDSYGVVAVAEIVGSSEIYDISVVKLPVGKPVKIPLSDELAIPGDLVYAFGNPSGLENTMTIGVVNGPPREEFIPHTAGIGPGSSGGPLVNYDGDVVGMNTMVLNSDFGVDIGFAITSVIMEEEIEKIINE